MDEPDATSEADLLGAWLSARDVPCPVCGYNLRTIASDACPECGARLELRLGSADLRLGPWLVAVLAVALPLGFVSIYTAFMGIMFLASGFGWAGGWLAIPVLVSAGYALVLARLIRRRRQFWKKARRAQRLTAALYLIISLSLPIAAPLIIWGLTELLW